MKIVIKIGVVGGTNFKNLSLIDTVLESVIFFCSKVIIISGEDDGTDKRAKNFAERHPKAEYKGFPPKRNDRRPFFARNKRIAKASLALLIFQNDRVYEGGAWNALKYFIELGKRKFMVFNEYGDLWKRNKLPRWINDRLNNTKQKFIEEF